MTKIEAEELWDEVGRWIARCLKVSGAVGFLVSVTYFLSVGSLPVDNFSGLLSLGSVIALISIGSFVVMILYWTLPTLAFHVIIDDIGAPAKAWFMSPQGTESAPSSETDGGPGEPYSREFPAVAAGELVQQGASSNATEGVAGKKKSKWKSPGDLNLAMWCIATVALPWTLSFAFFVEWKYETLKWTSGVAAMFVFVFALWIICSYVFSREPDEPEVNIAWKRFGVAVLVLFLNTFPLLIFLNSLNASDFAGKLSPWRFVELLGCAILLTAIAQTLALTGSIRAKTAGVKAHVWQLVVSTIFVVLGLFWLSAWSHVEDNIMSIASVRIPSARLAIAKPGCQALVSMGLAPALPASGPKSYESGCALAPVEVLSRVGSRWLVRCLESDSDAVVEPFNVKGDDVLSFGVVDRPAQATLGKPADSNKRVAPPKTFGSCRAVISQVVADTPTVVQAVPVAGPASAASGPH